MMQRIGFPTDFSELNLKGLRPAVHYARRLDCDLHLLHVVQPPSFFSLTVSFSDYVLSLAEAAATQLERLADRAVEAGMDAGRVVREVLTGKTVDELVGYGDREAIDLFVLPTHGQAGLTRPFAGSHAASLLRRTSRPMLALNPLALERVDAQQIAHVLFPTDLSEGSTRALELASLMARRFGARLHVLHALPDMAELSGGVYGAEFPTLRGHYEDLLVTMKQAAQQQLEALGKTVADAEVALHIIEGRTAEGAVHAFVADHASTLVVMSTHGHGGLERLTVGSVAARTLQSVAAPVLVLNPTT